MKDALAMSSTVNSGKVSLYGSPVLLLTDTGLVEPKQLPRVLIHITKY